MYGLRLLRGALCEMEKEPAFDLTDGFRVKVQRRLPPNISWDLCELEELSSGLCLWPFQEQLD
jgi:hypothetical protein